MHDGNQCDRLKRISFCADKTKRSIRWTAQLPSKLYRRGSGSRYCGHRSFIIVRYHLLHLLHAGPTELLHHVPGAHRNFVDNFFFRILPLKINAEPETRDYFAKIIVPLALTLADQQLVTGLAVLLAGFIKCDTSVYHFNIVTDLGWLASITHLNLAIVVRELLQKRTATRVWWGFAMISIASLLILTIIIQGNEY